MFQESYSHFEITSVGRHLSRKHLNRRMVPSAFSVVWDDKKMPRGSDRPCQTWCLMLMIVLMLFTLFQRDSGGGEQRTEGGFSSNSKSGVKCKLFFSL